MSDEKEIESHRLHRLCNIHPVAANTSFPQLSQLVANELWAGKVVCHLRTNHAKQIHAAVRVLYYCICQLNQFSYATLPTIMCSTPNLKMFPLH